MVGSLNFQPVQGNLRLCVLCMHQPSNLRYFNWKLLLLVEPNKEILLLTVIIFNHNMSLQNQLLNVNGANPHYLTYKV